MRTTHKPFWAVLCVFCAVTALISIIFDVFKSIFEERSHRSFLFYFVGDSFICFIHSFCLVLLRVVEWLTSLKINSVVHFCVKILELVIRTIWNGHKRFSSNIFHSWDLEQCFQIFTSPSDCLWTVIISSIRIYIQFLYGDWFGEWWLLETYIGPFCAWNFERFSGQVKN